MLPITDMLKAIDTLTQEYGDLVAQVVEDAERYQTPLLYTTYEDLERDWQTMLKRYILPFLGLRTDVQLSHLSEKRAGNLTHFQFIENYAEVYRALELRNQTDFLVDETQRDKKPTVLFRNVALR